MTRKFDSWSVCFFEDASALSFRPLTLTRPMDDLRVGFFTIREKWLHDLETSTYQRAGRSELASLFPANPPSEPDAERQLWVNSRLLPDPSLLQQIEQLKPGEYLVSEESSDGSGGTPLVIRTPAASPLTEEPGSSGGSADISVGSIGSADTPEASDGSTDRSGDSTITSLADISGDPDLSPIVNDLKPVKLSKPPVLLKRLWGLLKHNSAEIRMDIERSSELRPMEAGQAGIQQSGEYPVLISEDAVIEPGTLFLTTEGPIYIGKGAHVMAGSQVRGPAAICSGSTIKMGAKIYGNSTVGPVCKIGGEISNVIFHSYSNKAHDGFTGNSLFGQWCNLGADTNTSNLKNNYGTVKFTDWTTRTKNDTGEQFLGTIMADHSKTGINTMLTTGTNCGVCCNLFGHGYLPAFVPSFSWVNADGSSVYLFEKAVETMRRTMARRNVELTDDYLALMKTLFNSRIPDPGLRV